MRPERGPAPREVVRGAGRTGTRRGETPDPFRGPTIADMTAQVPDQIEVDGVSYALCGISGTGLFEPVDHGVRPTPISTACWRGYVCHYAVRDDRLRLAELHLGLGAEVDGTRVEAGTPFLGAPAEEVRRQWVFRWDALDVAFTGTLLAGDGFVASTYVHMGFTPAWKFERVLRLTVDGGAVTAREDLSEQMASTRESILADAARDPDGDRSDVPRWIARTFELGVDRSIPEPKAPPREV